ncbi:DUF1080 domain-containing protein [Isosphaeraceae bacterium EP7]
MSRLVWAAMALACLAAAGDQDGFVPMVAGNNPAQFDLVGLGPGSILVHEGSVRLTGEPDGYFATKAAYKNYVLRFDWRYDRPEGLTSDAAFDGNSGVLLHLQPPSKVWPRSIQVQLLYADPGNLFPLDAELAASKDATAQRKASRPVGEWNTLEVVSQDASITVRMNGLEIASGTKAKPAEGAIGWQSEGRPIEFRNIRIKVNP